MELVAIGRVESALVEPAAAPKQANERAPEAWLLLDEAVAAGVDGVQAGDDLFVFTWLHRSRRDVLRVHPRDDPNNPERGVFSTRSQDRPNPIGLHRVRVIAVEGRRLLVGNLEAVNETPIIDIKPVTAGDERPA